ncbi:unnamed protein product [marine sediment metagenome]|uniref:CheW-like domain-containing protein n=1 Tax=marine sediment metagenome TaxID=412755 RepID=X0TIG5_9ZZZZ
MVDRKRGSAAVKESMSSSKNSSQFVGFRLADQEYAFQIEKIQELVILESVTRAPQVADYVEGVSNLRGTSIPFINLRKLFGIEPKSADEETRTIMVDVGERIMVCTVDSVTQVMRIPADNIQPAPELVTGEGNAYVAGFARMDERLLVLLDIDELLEPEKLDEVNHAAPQGGHLPDH